MGVEAVAYEDVGRWQSPGRQRLVQVGSCGLRIDGAVGGVAPAVPGRS